MAILNYGGSFVNKAGDTLTGPLLGADGSTAAPGYSFSGAPAMGMWRWSAAYLALTGGGAPGMFAFSDAALGTRLGVTSVGFTSGITVAPDATLMRDGVGVLSQRSGINPQSYRVYNTFTDLSNYEVGVFDWNINASTLTIGSLMGGTGVARGVRLTATGLLTFATGSLARWSMDIAAGNLVPATNGTVSIGAPSIGISKIYFDYTNTAVVGAVTINKAKGRVNIAPGNASIVVTNSLCTANSSVFVVITTNDVTATPKNVVPGNGSFTITLNATPTVQTSVDFMLINVD